MLIKEISDNEYDIVIVGAGPAGISLALRLSEQSKAKVLLIESGALASKPEIHKLSDVEATGDLASNYYPKHAQRNFGGTSSVWDGYCTTLEKRAFLNEEWPIDYENIRPYYEDAAEILELPKEAHQTPSKMLADDGSIMYRPYYLSPPVRFSEKYFTYLSNHPNIDVLMISTCTNILSNGNTIKRLFIRKSEGRSNSNRNIMAKYYILACGGIGNARLMQLGGIAPKSPVGHYFAEHPHIYSPGKVELDKAVVDPVLGNGRIVHALQLSDEYCLKNNLLNFTVSFLVNSIENRAYLGKRKSVYISLATIRSEMALQDKNRVFLGEHVDRLKQARTRVDFHFNYQNLAKKTWDAFGRELLASGIGRATTPPDIYRNITGGGHYIGTTRMGKSEIDSVVDGNCKVHNIDNLYVAGSSIFSASAAANPTYSIVAFSLRLADHLATKI